MRKQLFLSILLTFVIPAAAETADTIKEQTLREVQVKARRPGITNLDGALNGQNIGRTELFKAACCNLGESFTTNPSVDVSYNDAATGARQIKLLGLSGTYVQMLTEQLPDFRGAALPFALGYVPGPWMNSIQVSKGCASVKNGYESITGQINVEYLKPENDQGVTLNLYGDSKTRLEANADANLHINDRTSGEILLHYENSIKNHDENNDGFYDKPRTEQYNAMTRWAYKGDRYIFHGGASVIHEERDGGQSDHHTNHSSMPIYNIGITTNRYQAYAKNALVLNPERGSNIALTAVGSLHQTGAQYGWKSYDVNEKSLNIALIYETNFTERHNLSVGASLNHDYLTQRSRIVGDQSLPTLRTNERETTPGAYAQYTFTLDSRLTAMTGLRIDHSSLYGTFVTPRAHIKYAPTNRISFRLSAGKGYRTVHALAENHNLLSSGRRLVIDNLQQEAAWNYGISASFNIPVMRKNLKVNVEYYYTDFLRQAIVDYDSDPSEIRITNLNGSSYSHTFQVDATYPFFQGFTLTAAYRLNDARTTYGGTLRRRPLTSRFKSLLTASYKTPTELWQVDATLQINGRGRMPQPYTTAAGEQSWDANYPTYYSLSAQVTRWFRHWSIYVGGENLTGYKQKKPVYGTANPWGADFEPTLVWGPVHGAMVYAGVRINFGRL